MQIVTGFGGRVDKHMGDAVMAVWGAKATDEDDAERAVRAGSGTPRTLAGLHHATGPDLAARGWGSIPARRWWVWVGSTAELTAMGDTVNVREPPRVCRAGGRAHRPRH